MIPFFISPVKLDLLFHISHLLDLRVGGQSLFITSISYYIQSANLCAMAIKSGRVIAWKAIMTVEAAGLRGSGH